jgi:hypothetical protein
MDFIRMAAYHRINTRWVMSVRFHIDAPVRNSRHPVYTPAVVAGWFVDDQLRGAAHVRVRVGSYTATCNRVNRPDVGSHFKATPLPCDAVGFTVLLPDIIGRQRLTVEAETISGAIIRLHSCWLNIQSWPPRPRGLSGWLNEWQRTRVRAQSPSPSDSVLVLIPVKPGTSPDTIAHARRLAERALHGLPSCSRIVFDERGQAPSRHEHGWRVRALAAIRQAMIEHHLGNERWVFWADLDLFEYSADLISTLIRRSEGGIAAPLVFMADAVSTTGGPQFYDVAGFVEEGRWADTRPPYFRQRGPVYNLDSVGCCYLVPADLYRRGARHEQDAGCNYWLESWHKSPAETLAHDWTNKVYTEHYSVCAFARKNGLPVRAFADLIALHEHVDDWDNPSAV